MTRSYRIRGNTRSEQVSLPHGEGTKATHLRRLLPGVGRDAGEGEIEAAGDEVVRVELENGFVLWSRADDLVRERGKKTLGRDGGEAWEIDLRPAAREDRSGTRGWLGLGIKVLDFFGIDLKGKAASGLGGMLEKHLVRENGDKLFSCPLNADAFALAPLKNKKLPPAGDAPILVFIHGTASNTQGSFDELWKHAEGEKARQALGELYHDRVYALEHRSLTRSPIQNALALLEQLPEKAQVHLVTHSRGGLVGELLCLGERNGKDDPLQPGLIDELFRADRTMAEQLGLNPLRPGEIDERNAAYEESRKDLNKLLVLLKKKQIAVRRFVRVACPARGTTLASGRLDRWLSVLNFLGGDGLAGDALDFLLGVVKERTDPRTLPGLEAMMPGSALTRLLQHPALVTESDLSVIAGDIEGESRWGQIKLLASDWFYGADHDLVVNTGSMYGGIRRSDQGARFQRDKGSKVNHFNYFTNRKSIRWLVAGLTRTDEGDGGFQPIQEAKHEAPKWREAVKRSRTITAPRPLAVVLPGIMGSALQAGGEAIWLKYLALFEGRLERLRMGGEEVVRPSDVLDDFYGPLIEFLARSHRVEVFPYDWRLSVRTAATALTDQLEKWLPEMERQGQPVHLVAHSMGGLVVRAMIADGKRGATVWRRILALPNSRFLMLGTPNLGSHEAVRWLTGTNPTQAKLGLLDIKHDIGGIIRIVNRFPGLLELLPFDPAGTDFTQSSVWGGLKPLLSEHWGKKKKEEKKGEKKENDGNEEKAKDKDDDRELIPEYEALIQARDTWNLLHQAIPDPKHTLYVAGSQPATVEDFRITDYDAAWLAGHKRLEFFATPAGDGTVTWRSGRLDGVKTWYLEDTAHDELCTKRSAFPGYLDLLMSGDTRRLSATPPGGGRAAADSPESFLLLAAPPADQIPDPAGLRGFGFGISRPFDAKRAGRGVPPIEVSLKHGNLAYAGHPVLVGHYLGDSIISAEQALDQRLDKALTQNQRLGLYPGPLGTHALFFNPEPDGKPGGAVVIGLGQVGELSPGPLIKGMCDAMLEYALRIAQWPDERFGGKDQPRSAALSCLLVGSGAGGMAVRDCVEAILRGAVAANERLVAAQMEGRVLIDRIELLELYEDVAIGAAKALKSVLRDGELAMRVSWPEETIEEGEGRLRRVDFDDAPDWWRRLEIVEDKRAGMLRFIATTERARAEETLATGQLNLADGFIRQASQSPGTNSEVAKTLFEMLLPNRLKELAPQQTDLVLLVDELSARYPWELLEDRWSHGNRPPAVAAGMVRQLKTRQFRPHPAHSTEATALVVGNPDLAGWDTFSDLPGARREAQKVAGLLTAGGYQALACVDERADTILAGLHRDAWRILHLAGHGEHEFELEVENQENEPGITQLLERKRPAAKRVSGMVIGRDSFLTPGDVQQMRWVPELVFINCCHLGKTQGETASQGRFNLLAANLAVEFIRMGVKAVVAAGWAVDDAAAETFATSFYTHMLDGESFGRAVRAAREEIWVRFPDVNTWGAYQCYGDPAYRLHNEAGEVEPDGDAPYHTPAQLISELGNYTETIRMRVKKYGDTPDELEALHAGINRRLGRIPGNSRDAWLDRADVTAEIGFVWGEIGDYAEAIRWLDKALNAGHGDCPVRAVEQRANFRVRLSAQKWEALRAQAESDAVAKERDKLVNGITKAIGELKDTIKLGTTMERLNLLGSANKRLAWVSGDKDQRLQALKEMADYYRESFDRSRAQDKADPYPFNNWAAARLLADMFTSDPALDQRALQGECRNMIQVARERERKKPNFWDGVAQADSQLVLLLARGRSEQEADKEVEHIAELYRKAAQRGASPREYASVQEHLDFVIALAQAARSPLTQALISLRAAI